MQHQAKAPHRMEPQTSSGSPERSQASTPQQASGVMLQEKELDLEKLLDQEIAGFSELSQPSSERSQADEGPVNANERLQGESFHSDAQLPDSSALQELKSQSNLLDEGNLPESQDALNQVFDPSNIPPELAGLDNFETLMDGHPGNSQAMVDFFRALQKQSEDLTKRVKQEIETSRSASQEFDTYSVAATDSQEEVEIEPPTQTSPDKAKAIESLKQLAHSMNISAASTPSRMTLPEQDSNEVATGLARLGLASQPSPHPPSKHANTKGWLDDDGADVEIARPKWLYKATVESTNAAKKHHSPQVSKFVLFAFLMLALTALTSMGIWLYSILQQ